MTTNWEEETAVSSHSPERQKFKVQVETALPDDPPSSLQLWVVE